MTRLRIDSERCVGQHGCAAFLHGLVDYDERELPVVVGDGEVPVSRLAHARGAEANCPEGAIVLDEDH